MLMASSVQEPRPAARAEDADRIARAAAQEQRQLPHEARLAGQFAQTLRVNVAENKVRPHPSTSHSAALSGTCMASPFTGHITPDKFSIISYQLPWVHGRTCLDRVPRGYPEW